LDFNDFDTSSTLPAADIKANMKEDELTVTHDYPVVTPNEEKAEFIIQVRASKLKSWRDDLGKLTKPRFPWAEVLLTLASLGWGGIIGAMGSNIEYSSIRGKLFYTALPMAAVGTTVAYFFVRKNENTSAESIAASILSEIPNPENEQSKP
jgi:hypothetical protein